MPCAEIVLPAGDLEATLAFFTARGFALESISPAESPRVAVVAGLGIRLRFDREARTDPGEIVIWSDRAEELIAPNGTRVVVRARQVELPPLAPSFVLTKYDEAASWTHGRAGMRYRDLVPGRQGGRFVASHIRVGDGGPVDDYVHFHRIRFQLIYCYRGWTRLVYEDQGPPFVMHAGECVLQPPEIRHRVLECGPGTEVIEVGSPAVHETVADPSMELPTPARDRLFGGSQSFVRHELARARWDRASSFLVSDLGTGAATNGLAVARVLRCIDGVAAERRTHDGELLFSFVLQGSARLACDGHSAERIGSGDAFVVPAGTAFALEDRSSDLEVFELVVS
jgi:quercetin dioxygenase-like cupin family protein